jgi:formylglycine-generating enzyme required for sulfatase activity
MSRRFLIAALLLLIQSTTLFAQAAGDIEGSKAGDRKELVPGIFFRWCPEGTFTMGEDDAKVDVELTKGFWLGETEVTQGQWQKVMGTTPWKGKAYVKEGENYAASYISHDDAVACCEKLTAHESNAGRLPKGWKFSLPTEAQWEYACRSGTTTTFSFGNNESLMRHNGWYFKNAVGVDEQYAHQVGQKKANAWGLRDMHGNVWEWCSDWYGEKLAGGRDPQGSSAGSNRVNRGSSWDIDAVYCRSANRSRGSPDERGYSVGFRLAAVHE